MSRLLIVFCCLLSPNIIAQWGTDGDLHSRVTHQQYRPDSQAEWEDRFRTEWTYDYKGENIGRKHWEYKTNYGRWLLRSETNREYDGKGRNTYERERYWDLQTFRLNSEYINELIYSDSLLLESKNGIYYFPDNYSRITTEKFSYDDQGRLTEANRTIEDSDYPEVSTNRYHYYYDNNGCMSANSSHRFTDGRWYKNDSSAYRNNADCDYNESYHYRAAVNSWIFYYAQKSESIYDQYGNLIELRYWEMSSFDVEWILYFELYYTYDLMGEKILETMYVDPNHYGVEGIYRSRTTYTYDESGRRTGWVEENNIGDSGEWFLISQQTRAYNDIGKTDFIEYFFQWDSVLMDFQDYLRSSYEYNENEEVSKVNDFQRSYSVYYETYNEYESETKYMYRCDGVMNDYVQTTLLNPEPSIEGEQYRVLTEYYEQPACAEIEPQDRILTIFPNPSSTYLTVLCHEPLGQANLRILDNMGRLVYENKNDFPNYFSIDLAAFNAGAHILQIDNGSYKSSQKFVVIK